MVSRPPRKNVMLAATISAGADSAPVRIRNLSEAGAMIDGPTLPGAGATLTLSRLELSMAATVVWSHDGQFRVDRMQAAIRSGTALPAETETPPQRFAAPPPVERSVAAELARVKRMLDQVSEELTDDLAVLTRHERALQAFDIAAMIVEELAVLMAADDREAALDAVQMHDLRSRLSGRQTLT